MSKQAATQLTKSNTVASAGKNTSGSLQRQCGCGNHTVAGGECEECKKTNGTIFRKANHHAGDNSLSHATYTVPQSTGQPLQPPLRHFMEARFNHDFSGVRLHTDSEANASAKSLGALAYTYGQDIFFDASSFKPNTPHGLTLIAHELTHVVQQSRHPLSLNEELRVEPETSSAEVEADRLALDVITPGPVTTKPSARSRGLNRGAGWAVLGGFIGAAVGLLGLLAGPIGLIAVAVGGAFGAWMGWSLSNDQTQDKRGSAGARIRRLLSTDAGDWYVSDEEAMAALKILQDLEKNDPIELFRVAMNMKNVGLWETLREELPPVMRPGLAYFDMVPLDPDRGIVMEGDKMHLEFYSPGQPMRSAGQREEARQAEIEREKDKYKFNIDKKKDDKDKKEIAPLTLDERMSKDYDVGATGILIEELNMTIPITGKTLKQAAELAAGTLTDPMWGNLQIGVDITPVKRGLMYGGWGQVGKGETVSASSTTKDTAALARREKRRRFEEHVPLSFEKMEGTTGSAARLYYHEVYTNIDKHDDPETLWKWAQAQAEKTYEEINKKTPREEFQLFAHRMLSDVSSKPKEEQSRLYETWHRYSAWVDKQSDEKLAKKDPVDIWSQAYVNIFAEEVHKSSLRAMEDLQEKRRNEAFNKAEEKLKKAIDFSIDRIYPVQPARGFSTGEQISETTGEVVEVGYLIQASPAEKIIRQKIASDFLHSQIERLMKDPEGFNKTSVKDDFVLYLNQNPDQLKALHLTMSHPEFERQEHKVDIPAWQTASEIAVGFVPFLGQGVAIAEVVGGRDLFGHPLTTTERTIIGVAILLPGIAKAFKLGKGAVSAAKIAREYNLKGSEAARVYKIYMGLAPGSTGAKLFDWGAREIKGGRAIEDPKVLKQMETVLKDLGMTEKETAKALMPAVERQVEAVAKEEVQALKTVQGAMTPATEEMLVKNAPLRQALKENNLAATVLKKCNTPCWPEEATAAQVQRLEHLLDRLKKVNEYDEAFLRGFLYKRRNNLDKAIDTIAEKVASAESKQAGKATQAAGAATKAAKKEAKVMDVAERNKAAADLERVEGKIQEMRADIRSSQTSSVTARKNLTELLAKPKEVPGSLKGEMARIEKLKNIEDRLEALEKLKPGQPLSSAEKEFLAWRKKTWELLEEAQSSEETAKFLGGPLETLLTQKERAAVALREASKDVMDVFRTEGRNYRGKSSLNIDQVMTKEAWEALGTKPALATDHLVALDRISKMPQLNEMLVLYTKASPTVKAEIKAALQGLGDMEKNLVRMRADVNSGIKSNKSWHEISYAQVEGKYTVKEVDAIRTREDEALKEIMSKIDELTNTFRTKVTGKPATAAAAGGAK